MKKANYVSSQFDPAIQAIRLPLFIFTNIYIFIVHWVRKIYIIDGLNCDVEHDKSNLGEYGRE